MKRRGFLQALLGAPLVPLAASAAEKLRPWELPQELPKVDEHAAAVAFYERRRIDDYGLACTVSYSPILCSATSYPNVQLLTPDQWSQEILEQLELKARR